MWEERKRKLTVSFTHESCFLNCFTISQFMLFLVDYSSGSHCGESYGFFRISLGIEEILDQIPDSLISLRAISPKT